MIESFLKYLQYEKRYSVNTVTSYQTDLSQLQSHLEKESPGTLIHQVTALDLRGWVVNLMERQYDPRSVNRKIATVKSFYKFLVKRELVQLDPTSKLKSLKIKRQIPQFVSEEDMNRLLDQFEFENSFEGWRDKAVLEILYGTGMRISELLGLRTNSVNFESKIVKVLGKRNKERIIPITNQLAETLGTYFEYTQAQQNSSDGCLILTDKGKPAYPMLIQRIVKRYLGITSTVDKKSPHVLRHTYATHLLNKGADLNAVKELLGHASLAATQVYTHNTMDKLKKVFDQAHPKA